MTEHTPPKPDTFGLPPSLRVPVASRDVTAIESHVGEVVSVLKGRHRAVNALKARTRYIPTNPADAPIWKDANSAVYLEVLFPSFQIWVHVDFHAYRSSWTRLGMPTLSCDIVLDHVANRRATRARGKLHPFTRLCPVSKRTNSNSGHRRGGEGMEMEYTNWLNSLSIEDRAERTRAFATEIVYADPVDLAKILDVAPGTQTLDGVRDFQQLFYG